MKKKLISLILVLALAFTFVGCDMFKKNDTRNLDQVVAEVKTGDKTDKITKRELTSVFLSQGYFYMQNYSYTTEQTLDYLLDQLINRKILMQEAFRTTELLECTESHEHTINCYFTEEEVNKSLSGVNEAINEELKGYEEDIEKAKKDKTNSSNDSSSNETTDEKAKQEIADRAVPSIIKSEQNSSEVVQLDKDSTPLRKEAFQKLKMTLKTNGFTFDEYYTEQKDNGLESALIEKYQENLENKALSTFTYSEIQNRYDAMLRAQTENVTIDPSTYETKLSEVAEGIYMLYNPYYGYSYVYNILLGFDEYQTAQLNDLKAQYEAGNIKTSDYTSLRSQVLAGVKAKDLRANWIQAEKGFKIEEGTLKFDSSICYNPDLFTFEGGYEWICKCGGNHTNSNYEDCEDGYFYFTDGTEYDLTSFLSMMNTKVGFSALDSMSGVLIDNTLEGQRTAVKKIIDLCFAFGTDTGMLTSYKGYSIAPAPIQNASETYVKEFANTARELADKGVGNYKVVATDFGYHIIYCSEVIAPNAMNVLENIDLSLYNNSWREYLDSTSVDTESFTYKFAKTTLEELMESAKSAEQTKLLKKYSEDKDAVVRHKSVYKDLY